MRPILMKIKHIYTLFQFSDMEHSPRELQSKCNCDYYPERSFCTTVQRSNFKKMLQFKPQGTSFQLNSVL